MAVQGRDTLFAVMTDVVYYQKTMQMEETAVITAGDVTCFFLPEDNKKNTFYTCRLKKVKGFEANLSTVQLFREYEEFVDQHRMSLQRNHPEDRRQSSGRGGDTEERDTKNQACQEEFHSLEFQNRFHALPVNDVAGLLDKKQLAEASWTGDEEEAALIRNSLLRVTKAVACCPDSLSRDVCCLL